MSVMDALDTTVVEMHRTGEKPWKVQDIQGLAVVMADVDEPGELLEVGAELAVGSMVALGPEARVRLDGLELRGGPVGRAHSFVALDAFRGSPNTDDVPKLIKELEELETQLLSQLGRDPLPVAIGPSSSFERAASREFAHANLTEDAASMLPEAEARATTAVVLFTSGESVCAAVTDVSVRKLLRLMKFLGRPVHPHPVDRATFNELLSRVYGEIV